MIHLVNANKRNGLYSMTSERWQLQTPVSAVIFDCDGTLSTIEGIDELAKKNGVSDTVQSLTQLAMSQSGLNPDLYQRRLDLVYPHYDQVIALGRDYFTHHVPDVLEIIQLFKRLNKTVYLISAGLYPAVTVFGKLLQIATENIFAVDIKFDENGNFLNYDKTSPLVHNHGKRTIIEKLKSCHQHMVYIGDGLNDYVTYDLVTRFVGYGGAFYRENIAASCQYYINTCSMAPLIPLTLTAEECKNLTATERTLYTKGLAAIQDGKVKA